MNLARDVWRSIVRRDSLTTSKGKSELVFLNLWLHIHPAKVHKEHLKFKHTGYLGFISFYLFLILVATGMALMLCYRPYPPQAYQDMKDLEFVVFLGTFLRSMHRLAATGIVITVFAHMCRVFYTASYKRPRQFNWVVGVFLLLVTLGLSFTGYLLPWDQAAFWAITVGTNIAGYTPVIGSLVRELLMGGRSVGEAALLRAYVLHVAFLPSVLVLCIMVHFWRVRKDGGLSRPLWKLSADQPGEPLVNIGTPAQQPARAGLPASPDKTYGLMAVVTGQPAFETVGEESDEDLVFSYPYAFYREAAAFLATLAAILLGALFYRAPLGELANSVKTPNPAKAPWYFLGLQELVSHSTFLGGVLAPALMVLALVALPYLDTNPSRRPALRKRAMIVFTAVVAANVALIVIGTFFRGPGWTLALPWSHVAGAR